MNGGNWQGDAQRPYLKMSHINGASEAIVFVEESDFRSFNWGTWVMNVAPTVGWVDPLAIYHGDISTLSFADGHAENHQWQNDATIRAANDSAKGKSSFFWGGAVMRIIRILSWGHKHYKHQDCTNWPDK